MDQQFEIEWGKLGLCAILLVGGFTLIIIAMVGSLPDSRFTACLALGSSITTGVMGYVFGNGRLASKGKPSVPMIAASSVRQAQAASGAEGDSSTTG